MLKHLRPLRYLGLGAFVIGFIISACVTERAEVSAPEPSRTVPAKAIVYPSTSGAGPISSETIDKYRTIAVFSFGDAPGTPGSGATVAGILASQLNVKGFTVVERSRLEQIFSEQRLQLSHTDEKANVLKVGQIAGAQAVAVGEVTQWSSNLPKSPHGHRETYVTIGLRLVDVESGIVLFSGDGYYTVPATTTPEHASWLILRAITSRLAVKVGLMSSGYTGFSWDLQQRAGGSVAVVTEFDPDSPARDAGLQSGDVILACNGSTSSGWKTQWQVMRACQVERGQGLALQVLRGGKQLQINVIAKSRFISAK
jgi:curli biogenesis system outer membrane secretion channel CsgG